MLIWYLFFWPTNAFTQALWPFPGICADQCELFSSLDLLILCPFYVFDTVLSILLVYLTSQILKDQWLFSFCSKLVCWVSQCCLDMCSEQLVPPPLFWSFLRLSFHGSPPVFPGHQLLYSQYLLLSKKTSLNCTWVFVEHLALSISFHFILST